MLQQKVEKWKPDLCRSGETQWVVRVSPADIGIVARTWDISQVAEKMFQKNVKNGAFLQQFPSDFSSDESVFSLHFMVGEECNFSFFQMIGKPHQYHKFVYKVDRYNQHVPVT